MFVNYLCLLTIITHPRDPRGRPKPRVKRKQKAKPRENPKPSRRHNGKPVTPFPRGVLWVWRCKIRAGLELVLVIFILDFFGLSVERNVFCILVYLVCFSDLLLKITFCMSKSHDGFWYYGITYIYIYVMSSVFAVQLAFSIFGFCERAILLHTNAKSLTRHCGRSIQHRQLQMLRLRTRHNSHPKIPG